MSTTDDDLRARWYGLGTSTQITLAWAARTGGEAYASDLPNLRWLHRQALVAVDDDCNWSATDAGRALYRAGTGRAA